MLCALWWCPAVESPHLWCVQGGTWHSAHDREKLGGFATIGNILHEWGVDAGHEGGDWFPMVMQGAVAVPAHFEHRASRRLVWMMREDVLDNVVVLLGKIVIRVHFVGGITQSHMLPMEVRLAGRSWVVPCCSQNCPGPTFTQ